MDLGNYDFNQTLFQRQTIKVITGLSNFNIKDIIKKVKAAEIAKATYVDIAANPEIVMKVKQLTYLPICVSSINPIALYKCILSGADMVEIGNFDSFYKQKMIFSDKQIINLAKETRLLLNDAKICVTIPHHLLLNEQIQLAVKLKRIGVDIIQTEGANTKNRISSINKSTIFNSLYKASSALSSSYAIANSVDIPVIASSGMDSFSAPIAISYGASCIGIGSVLNNFTTVDSMANYINEIITSFDYSNIEFSLNINENKFFEIYCTKALCIKV